MTRRRRQSGTWSSLLRASAVVTAAAAVIAVTGCDGTPDRTAANGAPSKGPTPGDSALRYVGRNDGPMQPDRPKPIVKPAREPAPRPTEAMLFEAGCINESCHAVYATARQVHGPIAVGNCSSCHVEDTGEHVFPMKRSGDATCTFCHLTGSTRIHRHQALDEERGCLSCHEAHVSDTRFLLVAPSIDAVCATCHPKDEGRFAHGPFGVRECAACHEPHESDHTGLLRGGAGPDHCFMCHTETEYAIVNAPFVHEPAHDDCTKCHSPHISNHENHLLQPIEQLCFSCHEDLEQQVSGAPAPHAAVFTARRCGNCHDAHASGRPKLLRARQTELCLECHSQTIRASDGHVIPDMTASVTAQRFLHGPVESGNCTACHNVHGSSHARLLTQTFPTSFYSKFAVGSYALCFTCHPQELVLAEHTDSLTDFRDGDLNLHYLHVNRAEKGRSCKACHAIHGSDLPKHIAAEVPFEGSRWLMPIGFRQTATGGSCAPGCHAAETYTRTPAVAPRTNLPEGGVP